MFLGRRRCGGRAAGHRGGAGGGRRRGGASGGGAVRGRGRVHATRLVMRFPVLVLTERAAVLRCVAPAARLVRLPTAVPTALRTNKHKYYAERVHSKSHTAIMSFETNLCTVFKCAVSSTTHFLSFRLCF